eukprot:2488461-Alexandrium_andersonii.AAC.1
MPQARANMRFGYQVWWLIPRSGAKTDARSAANGDSIAGAIKSWWWCQKLLPECCSNRCQSSCPDCCTRCAQNCMRNGRNEVVPLATAAGDRTEGQGRPPG